MKSTNQTIQRLTIHKTSIKRYLTGVLTLTAIIFVSGCAAKSSTIIEIDERDIGEVLLKVDPEFAVDNQPSALRANYSADTRVPMRTQPKSAELIIAPYTTKDGVYHSYSAIWIIVEDGDWAVGRFNNNNNAFGRGKLVITPLK